MTRLRHITLGALLGLLLVATACSSDPEASTTAPSSSASAPRSTDVAVPTSAPVDDSAIVQAVLDAWVADHPESTGSAFSVGVSRAGAEPVIAVSGERRDGAVAGVDWFRLGSVTKTYTAVALLRLVDEGRLDLDVPLGTYTDDVPGADRLTARHLLTHTSGLPDYLANPAWFESVSTDQERVWTAADIFALVDASEVQPGPFSYSNTNYVAAGVLLEAITGLAVGDAVEMLVLEPAGLADTDMASDGHDVVDGVIDVGDGTFVGTADLDSYRAIETSASSAGSISATPGDLLDFGRALADGELLAPGTFEDMLDTSADAPYGLGIANWELIEGSDVVGYGNYGEIPGYSAMLLVDPSTGLVLAVTGADDRTPVDALGGELQRAVLSGVAPVTGPTNSNSVPVSPDDATRNLFAGIDPVGPGCSVAVASDGSVVFAEAWGQARLDGESLTPATVFDVGSLTKQFTANAALLLEAQGRLDLDAPVSSSVADLPSWATQVTLRQLMHHTSGIPDYVELLLATGADLEGSVTTDDALAALRAVGLDGETGAAFEYSNSNYLLLGLAVEAAAGEGLDSYLQREIFGPLGLVGVVEPLADIDGKAQSYVRGESSWVPINSSWSQIGDGGLQTTPTDLVEWASQYWEPTIGDADITAARFADVVPTGEADDEAYGAGIRISDVEGIGPVLAHTGAWEAFISTFVIAPEQRVAIAVSCNAVELAPVRNGLGLDLLRIWTDPELHGSGTTTG